MNRSSVIPAFVRSLIGAARWKLALALALMVGLGLTSGAAVLVLVPLLHTAGLDMGQGGRSTSVLFNGVSRVVGPHPSLVAALAVLIGLTVAQGLINVWQLRVAVAINHDVVSGLRRRLFDAVCGMTWVSFTRSRSSDLLEAMTHEVEKAGYAARSLMTFVTAAIVTTVYGLLALAISPLMTLITLVAGGTATILLTRWRRDAARTGEEQSATNRLLYASLGESLANMKTIRVHEAGRRHAENLAGLAERERQLSMNVASAYGAGKLWFDTVAVALMSTVTLVAIRRLALSPAELLVLLFVFMRLAPQLASLHHIYQNLVVELPGFAAVADVEAQCLAAAQPAAASADPMPFDREVRVDRVSYSYGDRTVLSDVSLAIPAGHTVAVVGPSGAGKTTTADLILGLLTPDEGAVLVDGVALTPARMAAWRDQIGYVPQDAFLFHDTIRSNLLWAAPRSSDDELWAALHAAAASFVADLPAGLETVVGDRGVRLSGGERQRIALARALLRRPKLLILDEATSSLDSENERVIAQATTDLHGRAAILLITHRLSTVRHADMIYVIDDGRLVEAGRWESLTARRGRFQMLCRAQGIEPETVAAAPHS